MIRALVFVLGLLVADTAYAAPLFAIHSDAPLLRSRPGGWTVPRRITLAMHAFAVSLLDKPIGTKRERRIEGARVLARVEWHYWPDKGWHKGVTVYVRRRK